MAALNFDGARLKWWRRRLQHFSAQLFHENFPSVPSEINVAVGDFYGTLRKRTSSRGNLLGSGVRAI